VRNWATYPGELFERALVEFLQQDRNDLVQRAQAEEVLVAQSRKNSALHDLNCHLHLGFVARLIWHQQAWHTADGPRVQ
jgi:hypothetical protein